MGTGEAAKVVSVKNVAPMKVAVAILLFTAYAMTQDYTDVVLKASSVLWALSGLHMFLASVALSKHGAPKTQRAARWLPQSLVSLWRMVAYLTQDI